MNRNRQRIQSSPRLIALAAAWVVGGAPAWAGAPLPTGGTITSGAGSIDHSGNTLTINQGSQSLSANWQSFNIGAGNSVVFVQPNASSVALNRVIGPDASAIHGSLSANGKVFLVNPNGVLFAPGAQVSVGGLVASTLAISDEDFAVGRYRFTNGSGAGSVVNGGSLRGDSVVLIGPQVINNGVIRTAGGNTTLAAGDRVTVSLMDGLLSAQVDAAALNAEIQNHGQILADGGRVAMIAGRADSVIDSLINSDGIVQARGIRSDNGKIYLDGGAGGTVTVGGTLDASGTEAGTRGGTITALGKHVGLMAGADVNASGDAGGGTVLVGGNWQGAGAEHHARATYMDRTATIRADATRSGDGGTVVLWSEQYTGFYGSISARGGAQGGNGGAVETSSHDNLQAFGTVNASAPQGAAGQWLLDPTNVTIVSGAVNSNETNTGGVWTPTTNAAQIGVANINADLNAGTSVTINTATSGTAAGNITQNSGATISKTAGGNAALAMNAAGSITLNDSITSSAGALNVALSSSVNTTQAAGGSINTNGGTLTINAASVTLPGTYTVAGGMALNLTGTGSTLSGPVTGAGSLAISGGSVTVSGSKTFTGAFTATNSTVGLNTLVNSVSSATFTSSTINAAPGIAYTFGSSLTLNNSAFRVSCMSCPDSFTTVGSPVQMIGNNSISSIGNSFQQGLTFRNGFTGSGNVTLRAAASFRSLLEVTGPMAGYSGNISASAPTGQPYWVQINSADGWGTGTLNVTNGNVSVNYNYNTNFRLPYFAVTSAVNQPTATLNVTGGTFTIGSNMTIGALTGSPAGTIALLSNTATRSTLTTGVLDNPSDAFAGVMTGTGNFTKTGSGTQILSGNNTHTGTTLVSAGTLQVGNGGTGGTLGTGAVTTNANLVFNRSDTVNLSTLASNAAGITGTGNVSALIGGGMTVDRPIALTGASSSILLDAGDTTNAGTVSGGDVTLSSPIGTTAGGTVTIFSGHANTAALDAQVSGATGAIRYKTYNASASATGGAVAGTRNYYYRENPTLSVTGLAASKTYDGLVAATSVLDTSAASVSGAIEGDVTSYANVIGASASFGSAHAGSNLALNASFAGATATGTSAGANWSVSGYSVANHSASTGTITPKALTTTIDAVDKTYDATIATTSTLSAPTGFVGNDSATGVSGMTLAFDNPNAGTRNVVATGTPSIGGFAGAARGNGSGVGAGNEAAGLASDYTVVPPAAASATINQAALTVTANNDAKIVTQADNAAYNGANISGFVGGETAANLGGALSITRSNAGTEAAGNYAGVLVASGYTSGNYTIGYVNGGYRIVPAQELLVRIENVNNAYATTPGYAITSAQYMDSGGSTIHALSPVAQNGNTFTYSDGAGGSVTFTVAPGSAVQSGAGFLAAGNYALAATNTSIVGGNFTTLSQVGNQTVTPIGVTPTASGVSKVYDGTTSMSGLTMGLSGQLAGDALGVSANGAFGSKNAGSNVGYAVNGITLGGADAGNYFLTSNTLSGSNGVIMPRTITVSGIAANDKVYDGTIGATLNTGGSALNNTIAGDSVALDFGSAGASFADRNAGANKAVTVAGLSIAGADAANYQLSTPAGLTASITPRPLTVTATPNTKTFDGTTSAAATPIVSGSLGAGDAFTRLNEAYASAQAGTGLRLVPAATIDDGNGGANYAISYVDNLAGEIRPAIAQVGVGSEEAARLNRDRQARAERPACAYGDGTRLDSCSEAKASDGLVEVIAAGLRLPPGAQQTEPIRWDAAELRRR